ncbi:family 43 glycosylhydrolase [Dactylosporangium cerinum]|uniref:Family 43 glycosylhydrolase n=1 Tax=Dactylosporangium cerinum TaxID=1434730 RepID=A0ABV9WHL3_9ACTN
MTCRLRVAVAALLILVAAVVAGPAHADVTTTIVNSDAAGNQLSRFDVAGNSLDAHDGSLIQVGNTFYLYGTSYACGYEYQHNSNFCGFKVYSSPDLVHWTDRGYVVAPDACGYCFRPHVIYNAATARYVLWADGGGHYLVYTSSTPTGLFTRQPDPSLAVGGAVDEALYLDDDGTAYVIHNTVSVPAGDTADMVVERLTPDYLNTTGAYVRLGLGNVEGFTVFKRNGVYHALMSDPTCAYCSGETGEMTATSMLGPWNGRWYDPNGWNFNENQPQPRWRSRIVNATNCGGQPLASLPIVHADGSTGYYFVADRWNNRAPNESLANLYIGPMTFDGAGTLQDIQCVNSFAISLPGSGGAYLNPPDLDQRSGFDGFRHYCDIAGNVWRQQSFTPSRTGTLTAASVTSFQSGKPNAPLLLDVVDAAGGVLLGRSTFAVNAVPWAPAGITARPGITVTAGHQYLLRAHSATTSGCYGWEYNDGNPYAGGVESYSTSAGGSFTAENGRDLKFSTEVSATPALVSEELPAGWTSCAGEGATCTFTATRRVAYGAGAYAYRTGGSTACGIAAFGGDPAVGVLKSCYVAPLGGPSGWTQCGSEGGNCAFSGSNVVAYGANGAFVHRKLSGGTACSLAAFGGVDPIPGVAKACYLPPAGAPAGYTSCAGEGGTCTVSGGQRVIYGARGAFGTRWNTGSIACDNATFGDPIDGVVKGCYVRSGAPAGFGTACSGEGGTCSFGGFRTVAYGAAGQYAYRSFTGGTACTAAAFGGDPAFGVVKSCYLTP